MPRPKVRPEDRQRSSHACQTCKALKIRCDSQRPCSSCMQRGLDNVCQYSGMDRRRRKLRAAACNTHSNSIRRQDGSSPTHGVAAIDDNMSFELDGPVSGTNTSESENGEQIPPSAFLQEHLSLESNQSSKVYVGETSALSFLHFLRKTVKAYVGSVPFTDSERYHIVIDTDHSSIANVDYNVQANQVNSWMDFYYEATNGILDLFTPHEVDTLLAVHINASRSATNSFVRREDVAAIGVALAIGAQVKGSEEDARIANGYFRRARQVAFDDMLMRQNIGTVRLFLLMGFYMLGACHRNAASMFIGVAARAAINLELHIPEDYTNALANDRRRRTWHSMRNLDVLSSFVLSRPRSLPKVPSELKVMEGLDTESAFCAMGNGCTLLDDIVDTLSKGKLLDIATAEELLLKLRKWVHGLPPTLRQFHHFPHKLPIFEPGDKQHLMTKIHVSCVYYFGVILVTRPYLIAYLTSRLRGKAPDHLISDPEEASDVSLKNSKVSKMAQVCVSSSLYMIDMCRKAKSAGLILRNFCLLKAWIFGAGLILGFALLAGEPRRDIESLFESTLLLLDDIGQASPQARLYHQILTSLYDAVAKYRSRVVGELYRTVQDYMDQVLTIDTNMDEHSGVQAEHRQIVNNFLGDGWLAGAIYSVDTSTMALDPRPSTSQHLQPDPENWFDLDDMQLSGDLLNDLEQFDQLFYTIE
ncbi:hypothetical protein BDV33DRAFT_227853 [Aspergillus novoparasiticus]|uniref:Zn(2)-C6 fungal-type domain-containing protein n=1 Tax=Aspergillus novoparasiticus TaxID=986946 RepID=A0A5N6ECF5_9EURO|nr:hypothetical protein BDV33DRAFT_227853 [Aspergillus novoparasiticus]